MEEIKLPQEQSKTVQGILSKDIKIPEKAKLIHKYNDMCRKWNRKGGILGRANLSIKDMEKILFDRQVNKIHNCD